MKLRKAALRFQDGFLVPCLSGAVPMVTEVEEQAQPLKPFIKLLISFSRPELS